MKKIDIIIIEETFMVSAELFEFISNMFAVIYNNIIAFGGINIIAVNNLVQLLPITSFLIFRFSV